MSAPNCLDLFCGSGGLSLGIEMAGFKTKWANEIDPDAANTYKKNNTNTLVYNEDIIAFLRKIESRENGYPVKGEVDLISGGPPCQGFCQINRHRHFDDPRNSLVELYVKAVEMLQPRLLIVENVTGILTLEDGRAVHNLLAALSSLGYECKLMILQAGNFGIPQNRWRVFIIAAIEPLKVPNVPDALTGFHSTSFTGMRTWRQHVVMKKNNTLNKNITVWDALSDLPIAPAANLNSAVTYLTQPNSEYQSYLRKNGGHEVFDHVTAKIQDITKQRIMHIPPGGGWLDLPDSLKPKNLANFHNENGTFSSRYGRLSWDGTFASIVTKPEPYWGRYIHPAHDRLLSVRECARAQSFPDKFQFTGSISSRYRQVGNAVPPLLAYALAQKLAEVFI